MRPEARGRLAVPSLAACVAAAAAASRSRRCGSASSSTAWASTGSLEDAELSGRAAAPDRARRAPAARAAHGLAHAEVAGRRVELVPGCTEALEFSTLTRELRRLAEVEHVDAVVAAGTGPDEIVMRDVARAHPDVTLRGRRPRAARGHAAAPRSRTSSASPPTTARASRGSPPTRTARSGGGGPRRDRATGTPAGEPRRVRGRVLLARAAASTDQVARRCLRSERRRRASGAARRRRRRGLRGAVLRPVRFLARLARRVGDPARKLVLGPGVIDDPACWPPPAALDGVVGSSYVDPRACASSSRACAQLPGHLAPSRRRGGDRLSRRRRGTAGGARARRRRPGAAARRARAGPPTCSAARSGSTIAARRSSRPRWSGSTRRPAGPRSRS